MNSRVLCGGLLAVALWAPWPALADFQWHGFAAQGFAYSEGNHIYGDSLDGSAELSELGLNAYWAANRHVSFSGQILSRRAGEADDGEPRVDLAFMDLALLRASGHQLGLRFGRVKNYYGFFNEGRDVIFARPSILLPTSVYFDGQGFRSILFAADGAQWHSSHRHGANITELAATFALNNELSEVQRRPLVGDSDQRVEQSDFSTVRIMTDWDGGQFQTALSLLRTGLAVGSGGGASPSLQANVWVGSMRWNRSRFSLFSELAYVSSRLALGGPVRKTHSDGGYLQLDRYLTPSWTAFARYDLRFNNRNDRNGREAEAAGRGPAHTSYARTATLGMRWQSPKGWGVMGEWHHIDGTASMPSLDNRGRTPAPTWDVWLLMVGLRF